MEFSRLKASIANNAGEEPSVYMAVCMIESLFDDIEDMTGQDVSACPSGSETLPTKLVWLCQTIRQIYEDKSDELVRNRSRLDKTMETLKRTEEELESFAKEGEELAGFQSQLKEKQADLAEKKRKSADLRTQLENIEEQAGREIAAARTCEEQICALQKERDLSIEKQRQAAGELEEMKAELLRLKEEGETYRTKQIEPVLEELRRARLEREGAADELEKIAAQHDEMVTEIAAIRLELEKKGGGLEQKKKELEAIRQQSLALQGREEELKKSLREVTQSLGSLQSEVARLENEQIPERERQQADEEERREKLEEKQRRLEAEIKHLREDCAQLEKQIETMEKTCADYSDTYNTLTADYKNKSAQVERLDSQLKDLQGKTDMQKYEIYKRQIEEQMETLKKVQEECADMEKEIAAGNAAIEEKQARRSELEKQREQGWKTDRELSAVLRELEPVAGEDFAAGLAACQERLQLLCRVRSRLEQSLGIMERSLGRTPAQGTADLSGRMKEGMQDLAEAIESLRLELMECAQSVRLEER